MYRISVRFKMECVYLIIVLIGTFLLLSITKFEPKAFMINDHIVLVHNLISIPINSKLITIVV